jgi:plastocyanin
MRTTRWARLVAGLFAISLVLAACGGDDDGGDIGENGGPTGETTNGATGETEAGGDNTIVMQGFAFQPSTIEVSGPTEFTIVNEDTATHTFTLDDGSIDETVAGGASVTVTIDVTESQPFVCTLHPGMDGTIEVV